MASAAFWPFLAACDVLTGRGASGASLVAPMPSRISLAVLRHSTASILDTRRRALGLQPMQPSAALDRAALVHARDLAAQGRMFHAGAQMGSPPQRAAQAGFDGRVLGEVLARSPDSEVIVLGGWLEDPETRAVLLDPQATAMGLGVHQVPDGSGWWVLLTGTGADQG